LTRINWIISSSTEERTRLTQNRATAYNGSSLVITGYASELIFLLLYTSLHARTHIQKHKGKKC
jgi:hypothetical protein